MFTQRVHISELVLILTATVFPTCMHTLYECTAGKNVIGGAVRAMVQKTFKSDFKNDFKSDFFSTCEVRR